MRWAQGLSRTTVEHDRLAKLVGKWDVTVRTHGPNAQVQEGKGRVVGQAILGGRYIVLNYQLKLAGQRKSQVHDVEAVQIVGFDTLRQVYTASWRDSATTWPVECEGEPAKQVDVLVLRGSMVDASTPNGRPFRMMWDLQEPDQVTVRVFEGRGQAEVLLQVQRWQR